MNKWINKNLKKNEREEEKIELKVHKFGNFTDILIYDLENINYAVVECNLMLNSWMTNHMYRLEKSITWAISTL